MADPAAVLRTGLAAVLVAVRAQIASITGIPAARVRVVGHPDQPRLDADQDVLLWPRGFTVEQGMVAGGGRVNTWIRRRLTVITRTRVGELDEAGENLVLLTHATLGAFALEEIVADALQIFGPTDADGNELLVEPMRLLSGGEPVPLKKEPGWCDTAVDYEACYVLALTQTRQ